MTDKDFAQAVVGEFEASCLLWDVREMRVLESIIRRRMADLATPDMAEI